MNWTNEELRIFERFIEAQSLRVSEWAERYRYVAMGAHVGRWRNDISPHLVKIMDTWQERNVREVVILKVPQSGGSEAMLNMIAYALDNDNAPVMIVVPTQELARKMMKDRIIPMIQQTEKLAELVENYTEELTRFRVKLKTGARLYVAWANSATALASFPVKYLFFDEMDKYPIQLAKEADPVSLAEKRTTTFKKSYKIVKISTPTTPQNYIYRAW
ncbi:phage terminase large subunit family protein, partial [Candidatus Bathyarchaeota archaeon]|nr:phage terminase large subunit family protein [Candidatus Bathyarchaeota archaeon]